MKYKLVATLDEFKPRKWKTLQKLVEFGNNENIIEYLTRRCSIKNGYEIDSDKDTDEVIFDIGTYRLTYRDMMCEECFLYAWV
jgi:hypothetical protein